MKSFRDLDVRLGLTYIRDEVDSNIKLEGGIYAWKLTGMVNGQECTTADINVQVCVYEWLKRYASENTLKAACKK